MCMPSVLYTLHYISVKHIAMKKPSAVFDMNMKYKLQSQNHHVIIIINPFLPPH